mgnify:CR=1 FL=1
MKVLVTGHKGFIGSHVFDFLSDIFDVDGLDSSIMPATGTPEPGGLFWDETLNIIKIAAKNSNIVGADINELAPIKGFNSYNFLVAKLAYKILSYIYLYKN